MGNCVISDFPVKADLYVFSKPYHSSPGLLAATLEIASHRKYIFDLCDDLFWRTDDVVEYTRQMIKNAACVTTSTESMKDVIIEETGVVPVVISDPCEFSEKPIKDISEKKLMWFGTPTNVASINRLEINYPLEIVTQLSSDVEHLLKQAPFEYTFTEWSLENMEKAFERNNIVVIPADTSQRKKRIKSPNRVFESIRNGLSVVASPIDSYKQFSKWINLDMDIENVKQITPEAQKYVRDNFDISVIGEQWKTLISSLTSDAEVDSLMVG
jgi:hypothetical protein